MILETISSAVIVLAWIAVFFNYRKKRINLGEFLLWTGLWVALIIAIVFQELPNKLSSILGIPRAVDVVLYPSIFLLFFLIFRLYVRLESQEKEITRITRELALQNAKKKQ